MVSVRIMREKLTLDLGVDKAGYDIAKDPDCWWTATNCTWPRNKGLIFPDVTDCSRRYWDPAVLTIDGGPNCSHNALYDFLNEREVNVTLFYVGSNVVNWPLQAQRGIVDGQDLCVNSWSQRYMTTLPSDQVFAELYYTMKSIKIATGVTPTCWRPPFGDVDDRVRAIASELGLRTVMWNFDPNGENIEPDGNEPKEKIDQNYETIFYGRHGLHNNSIVRVHELNEYTMKELQRALTNLTDCGFSREKGNCTDYIMPLSRCNGVSYPYPENITYPNYLEYDEGVAPYGLPNGSTIHVDPQASVHVIPLRDNYRYGFGLIDQASNMGSGRQYPHHGKQDNMTYRADLLKKYHASSTGLSVPNTVLAIILSAAMLLLAIIPI